MIAEAKDNANNQITANQMQATNNINEAIGQPKEQAKNEISGAKKTDHYQNIDFFEIE
ncbi:hypothetical protein HpBT135_15240 [Helicobacter pylori]